MTDPDFLDNTSVVELLVESTCTFHQCLLRFEVRSPINNENLPYLISLGLALQSGGQSGRVSPSITKIECKNRNVIIQIANNKIFLKNTNTFTGF